MLLLPLNQPMNNFKTVLYRFGLLLGFGIFLYQIIKSFNSLTNFSQKPLFGASILLCLLIAILVLFFQILNWRQILGSMQVWVPLKKLQEGYVLSFLPRYIPGSIWGYLSRGEWLKHEFNIPYGLTYSASIMEILIALSSGILIAGVYTIAHFSPGYLGWRLLCLLILPWLIWFTLHQISLRVHFKWSSFQNFIEYFRLIKFLDWVKCLSIFCIQWLLLGLIPFIFLYQYPDLPGRNVFIGLLDMVTINSISWIIGLLIIIFPTGLGIREFSTSLLIAEIFQMPAASSMALAVISRLVTSFSELIWLIIVWLRGKFLRQ